MEKSTNNWNKGAFFICSKCGVKMERPQLADEIKNQFKARMKDVGKSEEIRVMVSSCLNECPENLQAAVYCGLDGTTETWVFHPDAERAAMQAELEKKAGG